LQLAAPLELPHVVVRVLANEPFLDDIEVAADALRDLARRDRIAELPVVLGDRFVAPRQHELVTEREVVVAPPERPAHTQATIRQ